MPRTISASDFDAWANEGLSDFGDFAECVEYRNEAPSGFGDSEGEWYYADEANLVLYYGTYANDHSPGASHYTSADVYESDEIEDFRAAARDWEDEPESLDEEEDYEPNEPEEDDYVISDCGPLGSMWLVSQYGKPLGTFEEREDADAFIREHMDSQGFFPNVWWVSDHGNYHLTSVNEAV